MLPIYNSISPVRHHAVTWTNAKLLSIKPPPGTNLSEIGIQIPTLSLEKSIFKCRLKNGGHIFSVTMFYEITCDCEDGGNGEQQHYGPVDIPL